MVTYICVCVHHFCDYIQWRQVPNLLVPKSQTNWILKGCLSYLNIWTDLPKCLKRAPNVVSNFIRAIGYPMAQNDNHRHFLRSSPVVLMKGADLPCRAPRTLFRFNSQDDIDQFAIGCDADIGGTSTVHLERYQNEKEDTSMVGGGGGARGGTGVFWGDMRLGVKAGLEGKIRGGYAGFRNKVRCFNPPPFSLSLTHAHTQNTKRKTTCWLTVYWTHTHTLSLSFFNSTRRDFHHP